MEEKTICKITFEQAFTLFEQDKRAEGIADKTLFSYLYHYKIYAKYIPPQTDVTTITQLDIKRMVLQLADKGLSRNSVRSYTATLKTFFHWCRDEGLSDIDVKLYKGEETIPATYTEEELKKLLRRPDLTCCTFGEFKAYTIVNLLINNGVRASTVRNIKNKDVYLEQNVIYLRHMKAKKTIAIPMSISLKELISQYMQFRGGFDDDYLFPDKEGNQMTESCLRKTIVRYNESRGVKRHGIHMFRHTFARMYLVNLHGDALKLQKLLGHSTLDMTKHYVKIFDEDLIQDFSSTSPLEYIKKSSFNK